MSSDDNKAKSKSVTLTPDLWARIEARSEQEHRGNRSEYFRSLAERDMGLCDAVREDPTPYG